MIAQSIVRMILEDMYLSRSASIYRLKYLVTKDLQVCKQSFGKIRINKPYSYLSLFDWTQRPRALIVSLPTN